MSKTDIQLEFRFDVVAEAYEPAIITAFERPNPTLSFHEVHRAVGNVRNNTLGNLFPTADKSQV